MSDTPNNSAVAIEARGEFSIALEGVEHVMRPSFEALVSIETATGKSLIELANASTKGALSLREMATVAAACIRAYGRATGTASHAGVQDQRVLELVADLGALHALKPIQQLLIIAATGGVTSSGELKAVVESPKAGTATAG